MLERDQRDWITILNHRELGGFCKKLIIGGDVDPAKARDRNASFYDNQA